MDKKYLCHLHLDPPEKMDLSDMPPNYKNINYGPEFEILYNRISNLVSKEDWYTDSYTYNLIWRYRLESIKIYKYYFGIGLKEAKDIVDSHLMKGEFSIPIELTKNEIFIANGDKTNTSSYLKGNKIIGYYFDGVDIFRNSKIDEIL